MEKPLIIVVRLPVIILLKIFFDQSIGFIIETQRNLVLQYGNSNIFQKNYVSRYMLDT